MIKAELRVNGYWFPVEVDPACLREWQKAGIDIKPLGALPNFDINGKLLD